MELPADGHLAMPLINLILQAYYIIHTQNETLPNREWQF